MVKSRKETSRQRIINAATKLFAQHGFSGTSIRDIAGAAGTTIPNIYHYFGSKDGLYQLILMDAMTRVESIVTDAAKGVTVRDRLVSMGKAKHQFLAQHPELMRIFLREQVASESGFVMKEEILPVMERSLQMIADMVQQGIDNGEFRQVDPGTAAWFLLFAFSGYASAMGNLGRTLSDAEIETGVDLALEGLRK
jgi:AcrR family transcriptional regulator